MTKFKDFFHDHNINTLNEKWKPEFEEFIQTGMAGELVIYTLRFLGENSSTGSEVSNMFWTGDIDEDEYEVMDVPVKKLYATQDMVYVDVLRKKTSSKKLDVVLYKNKYYVVDGHHEAVDKILNGKKKLPAKVYKIDKIIA